MLNQRLMPVLPIILLTSIIILSKHAKCSGVFELELIKFQPLDVRPPIQNHIHSNATSSRIEQQQDHEEDQNSFIRVLVCLKEAFTSHLDGTCTFGNASITLSKDSIKPHEATASYLTTNQIKSHEPIQRHSHNHSTSIQQQQQQQTGSLMTNVVRILFTFRWTVSSRRNRLLVFHVQLYSLARLQL